MGGGEGQDRGSLYSDSGKSSTSRSKRYSRFGDALKAAAAYKEKAKAEKEAEIEMGDEDDDKGTKGFKISPDATVVEGYRDPGFSLTQEGSAGFGGLIGTVGGAVIGSAFGNPMMGANIGSKVGSYF